MKTLIAIGIALAMGSVAVAANFDLPVTLDSVEVLLLRERWGVPGTPATAAVTQTKASEVCSTALKSLAATQLEVMGSDIAKGYSGQDSARQRVIFDKIKDLREGR